MTPTSRPNLLWPTLTALVMLAGGGCTKNGASGVRDPEKASLAEHDVAVDEFNKGSLRSALVHAQKAVEFNEDNSQAQLMAATIYLAFCATSEPECRLGEAEQHARAALKIKPDFASATNTLGVILVRAKRYDDAIAVLKPLTENMVYSTPELAWGNLGQAYLEKGDPDQAIVALRRAVALQPGFCVGTYRLGQAYERKGDLRAAQQAYTTTVEAGYEACRFADVYEARARVLSTLDDSSAARADLQQCVRIGAGSPTAKRCGAMLGQASPSP